MARGSPDLTQSKPAIALVQGHLDVVAGASAFTIILIQMETIVPEKESWGPYCCLCCCAVFYFYGAKQQNTCFHSSGPGACCIGTRPSRRALLHRLYSRLLAGRRVHMPFRGCPCPPCR